MPSVQVANGRGKWSLSSLSKILQSLSLKFERNKPKGYSLSSSACTNTCMTLCCRARNYCSWRWTSTSCTRKQSTTARWSSAARFTSARTLLAGLSTLCAVWMPVSVRVCLVMTPVFHFCLGFSNNHSTKICPKLKEHKKIWFQASDLVPVPIMPDLAA